MRGRKPKFALSLTDEARAELEQLCRRRQAPAGEVRRAEAILLIADGKTLKATSQQCGLTERITRKWIWRFIEQGRDGLKEKSGRGRKPVFSPQGQAGHRQACL